VSLVVVCDATTVAHPLTPTCEHPQSGALIDVNSTQPTAYVARDLVGVLMPGDALHDFRGDVWQFIRVSRLATESKSAKVIVEYGGTRREFYASVFPNLTVSAL
jgi:hypothetical protein